MNSSDRINVISISIQEQVNAMLDELENKPWPLVAQIDDQLSFGFRILSSDEFRVQVEAFQQEDGKFTITLSAWFTIPETQFPGSQIFALAVPQGRLFNTSYALEEIESESELFENIYNLIREFIPEAIRSILE